MNTILVKAYGKKDISKLTKKQIIDKRGRKQTVYVKQNGIKPIEKTKNNAYDSKITVSTQAELDAIPVGFNGTIEIRNAPEVIKVHGVAEVFDSKVRVDGAGKVSAYGNSEVASYGISVVKAYDNSKVSAHSASKVSAHGNSDVSAYDRSTVKAYDNSKVELHDIGKVSAHGNSKVKVYDNGLVFAHNNSEVELHDDAKIAKDTRRKD